MTEKFTSFSPDSKIWIYSASRSLNEIEISEIQLALDAFTSNWTAHGVPLQAKGEILNEHFIVLMVDESIAKVSGCGIDKSVKLLQDFGAKYSIELFNRMLVYFETDKGISIIPLNKTTEVFNAGIIGPETFLFNTLVQTKNEFENNRKVKVKDTWLGNRLGIKN
jgi:hypothetical protein